MDITITKNTQKSTNQSNYKITVRNGSIIEYNGFTFSLSRKLTDTVMETDRGIFSDDHRKVKFKNYSNVEIEVEMPPFNPDELTLLEIQREIISRVRWVKHCFEKVETQKIQFKL